MDNLGKKARSLASANNPEGRTVSDRQKKLEDLLDQLQRTSDDRRKQLEHSKDFHDYTREAADVQDMINEQMQTASSEDYGQDYEHLLVSFQQLIEITLCISNRFSSLSVYLFRRKNIQQKNLEKVQNKKIKNRFDSFWHIVT